MKKRKDKLKILILSFDMKNLFENDFDELMSKMERDRLNTKVNRFFLINWSSKSYYKKVDNFETEHILSRIRHFRVLYDFLLIFVVPFVLWRRKFKPDIIWVKDFPVLFSVIIPKIIYKSKIVIHLSATPVSLVKTRKNALPRVWYQRFSEIIGKHFVDYFLANGQATKDYLVNLGIKEEKVEIKIGNIIGRDMEYIQSSRKGRIREKYKIKKHEKIILSVGRLEPEKGFDRLLEAISKLKRDDLKLIIAGEGRLKKDLEMQIKKLNLENQVILAGQISREKIWDYYNDADVFVLLSYSDGSPNVVREAMYMETPVIGSKIDSIKAFIGSDNKRGFLWDEEDGIESLNNILEKCFNKDENTKIMLKNTRDYMEEEVSGSYTINDYFED